MTADSARAALIDLASAWRRAGLQMETEYFDTARAVVYAECAKQLDELTVTHLGADPARSQNGVTKTHTVEDIPAEIRLPMTEEWRR